MNRKVPKSCSLTPVKNASNSKDKNNDDDDDDVKFIEEKRTGVQPDAGSKAAEALRELKAYMEQSISNINEQTARPKEKENDKNKDSPLPVISNVVTLNKTTSSENEKETPKENEVKDNSSSENDSTQSESNNADSKSDAASRDSGISDVKHTQEFDPNEDWCAVCHEGGDLLCCSNCPRVFHYKCHVPAVTKEPKGDWSCNMCKDISKYPFNGLKRRTNGLTVEEMNLCERILLEILCYESSQPFHEPVSHEVKGYHDLIKSPMDLSTIRTKISDEKYDHIDDYLKDIHTIFENCYTFNTPESDFFNCGKRTEGFFLKLLNKQMPNNNYKFAHAKVPDGAIQSPLSSTSSSDETGDQRKSRKRKNWAEDLVQLSPKHSKDDEK